MSFVHLHTHTEFSLLDGANRVNDLINRAKELNMPAVAMTDHGNMFGAVKFFMSAKKAGIKPIIGQEFYLNPISMAHKKAIPGVPQSGYHLTLLAQNEKGWKNIVKLSSMGYTEGFYYKPKIDMNALAEHSDGVICLGACLQGEVPNLLLYGKDDEARKAAKKYLDIFGTDRFYLELMDHGIQDERKVLPKIKALAREMGIDTVATNDSHYITREEAKFHDILLAVGTKQLAHDETRKLKFLPIEEFYFKSSEEMRELFSEVPESCDNTLKIADMIDFELETGVLHFPEFPLPEGQKIDEYLRETAERGMNERYDVIEDVHRQRLEHELKIIIDMGFPGYFAIVADFCVAAREMGVSVGPGRGSGGGSLVAYAMGITDFDPIRYDLLFERFLNPERKSMPDFDIDFTDNKRENVIDYVRQKYGAESVAHIISFGTMKAKAAVKDVGRALGKSFDDMNTLAKLLHDTKSLKYSMENIPELVKFVEDNNYEDVIEAAYRLENLPRHTSMHAAGIVIAPGPITDYVPLYRTNKDEITTQFDKNYVEDLGLLKMDFLGLRTLTVIDEAVRLVSENKHEKIDIRHITLDDPKVYDIFTNGETAGVFQFESDGMTKYLMQLKPDCIDDLIAMNALYRPGPMENIPSYIARKHGEEEVEIPHEDLTSILGDTYGIIVYQEQVMQIPQKIADFSLGDADILRRAMSKKKKEEMAKQQEVFVTNAVNNGYNKKLIEDLFALIDKFSNYGFNKSHAAAYSILAYQTAYLKRYFPIEFMAANLSSEIGNADRVNIMIEECKRLDIEILPPAVNFGQWSFSVENDNIRFGMGSIKNVGFDMINGLIQEREKNGKYTCLYDFCDRVYQYGLNSRSLQNMIYAGALDELGPNRASLSNEAENALKMAQGKSKQSDLVITFFDSGALSQEEKFPEVKEIHEWDIGKKLEFEKQAVSMFLSGHPLQEYFEIIEGMKSIPLSRIQDAPENAFVRIVAQISSFRKTVTKKGDDMAFGDFEDESGTGKFTMFPKPYKLFGNLLEDGKMYLFEGRVSEDKKIFVDAMCPLSDIYEKAIRRIHIRIDVKRKKRNDLIQVTDILRENKGSRELIIHLKTPAEEIRALSREFRIAPSAKLLKKLRRDLGKDNIWLEFVKKIF